MAGLLDYPELMGLLPVPSWDEFPGRSRGTFGRYPPIGRRAPLPSAFDAPQPPVDTLGMPAIMPGSPDPGRLAFMAPQASASALGAPPQRPPAKFATPAGSSQTPAHSSHVSTAAPFTTVDALAAESSGPFDRLSSGLANNSNLLMALGGGLLGGQGWGGAVQSAMAGRQLDMQQQRQQRQQNAIHQAVIASGGSPAHAMAAANYPELAKLFFDRRRWPAFTP